MQNHKDNFRTYDENPIFEIAITSVIGDREEQQDSVGYEIKPKEGLVVICDGMGGHNGGSLASSMAVDMLTRSYLESYPTNSILCLLRNTVEEIDRKVASLTDCEGKLMRAGTTIVAVVVRGKTLNWISVGDSRIYIYRNGELVQVTEDHIYQMIIDEKREVGIMNDEEHHTESIYGEALVSFLGINGLPMLDINDNPFELLKDDRLLLASDGLYKLIPDEEIRAILSNFNNIEDALNALQLKAQKLAKNQNIVRDNTTVALIKIK